MYKKGSCWEGYVQKGMKKKGNRMVPNCVPAMKTGGLTKWFNEKWVDIGARKKGGKYQECGRKSASSSSREYPKCVPLAKATQMTSSQKASAVKRKRAAGNPGGKPTNVKTFGGKQMIKNFKDIVIFLITTGVLILLAIIIIGDYWVALEENRPVDESIITLMKMSVTGLIGVIGGYIGGSK